MSTNQRIVRTIKLGEVVGAKVIDVSKYKDAPLPVCRFLGLVKGTENKMREDGSGEYTLLQGSFAVETLAGEVVRSGLMICPEPLIGEIKLLLEPTKDENGREIAPEAVKLAYTMFINFNPGKGVAYTFTFEPVFAPEALGQRDPLAELMQGVAATAGALAAPKTDAPAIADASKEKAGKAK